MTDCKIKHFVIIRFFPKQFPDYPHDIFDVDFLSEQLSIAKNAMASLDNQTNKNFEIVFIANEKFFSDEKYEFIFSTLKASTKLPVRFIKTPGMAWMYARSELPDMLKAAFDEYDYVIQTRMDFDDFVYKDAVADTQDKVSDCENVLAYGYCNGYRHVLGELFKMDFCQKGGHQGVFQSLILKSSFAKNLPFLSVYSFRHDEFKTYLKNFLEKHGVEFSDKMFRQELSHRVYIYVAHDFSHYLLSKRKGDSVAELSRNKRKRKPLTTADITKAALKDEFGFFLELKSIE